MSTKEVLIKARELISNPAKWGQGDFEPRQGAYCASGAIRKVTTGKVNRQQPDTIRALNALQKVIPDHSIPRYNDHHPHECVLEMFDQAIAKETNASSEANTETH